MQSGVEPNAAKDDPCHRIDAHDAAEHLGSQRPAEDEQHGEEARRADEEERPAADAVDVEEGVRFEDELDDPHRDRPEHRRQLLADARPLKDDGRVVNDRLDADRVLQSR